MSSELVKGQQFYFCVATRFTQQWLPVMACSCLLCVWCVQVKLWNVASGFCFVTFSEHSSAVTGAVFSSSGKVVVSASLDGTVRAFDLHRLVHLYGFIHMIEVGYIFALLPSSGIVTSEHLPPPGRYNSPV